jgi:TolB-like protein/DNA-binding winged helix-turn-helix (wHTH) protein
MDAAAEQRPAEGPSRPAALAFGGFVLDPTRGVLRGRDGAELPLRPKSFDVLRHLAEQAGRLVPRDELMAAVWPDVFVTDDSITQCVVEIRHVLGAEGPRLLRTVPRRGYMLAAEVTRVAPPPLRAVPAGGAACAPGPGAEPDGRAPGHRRPRRPVLLAGAGAAAALAAGAAGWWRLLWWPPSTPAPLAPAEPPAAVLPPTPAVRTPAVGETPASRRLSLVVLPFANEDREAEQDGAADAITDTLTTVLSRDSLFFVIGRGAARTYKGLTVDVRQVGRELGVRYAVQGTVRRQGDRNAIAVQLLDTGTGRQLWAEQFDLPRVDLAEQARLATGRVQRPVSTSVIATESARSLTERPDDPDAMDLLVRGVALFGGPFTRATIRHDARRLFERAVALDPGLADAHAYLGATLIQSVEMNWSEDREADLQAGEHHLERALAMVRHHAWARIQRAWAHSLRWRFDEALVEHDLVIALNPSDGWAYARRGVIRLYTGRPVEAVADLNEALRTSSRDASRGYWSGMLGIGFLMLGRDEDALAQFMQAVAMYPENIAWVLYLASAYALVGRVDEARTALREIRTTRPDLTVSYIRPSAMRFSPHPAWRAMRERQLEGLRLAGLPDD